MEDVNENSVPKIAGDILGRDAVLPFPRNLLYVDWKESITSV
jgi:hypothetical protein